MDDVLKVYSPMSMQSIIIPDVISLPLKMRGVLSYLPTRKPNERELHDCDRYELTSAEPWNPYDMSFGNDREQGPHTIASMHSRNEPPELAEGAIGRMVASHSFIDTADDPYETDVIAHSRGQGLGQPGIPEVVAVSYSG